MKRRDQYEFSTKAVMGGLVGICILFLIHNTQSTLHETIYVPMAYDTIDDNEQNKLHLGYE